MKVFLLAAPLLTLAACDKAGDATLNNTSADADMVVETENMAAVNELVAEGNSTESNSTQP